MIGSIVVAFSLLASCQAKIDYYTKTEWTYINETEAFVDVRSNNGVYAMEMQPSEKAVLFVELPANPQTITVSAQLSPFYDGATLLIDGKTYQLPGFTTAKDILHLPSICNAKKYSFERKDNTLLFSFIINDTFIKEIQPYRTKK